MEKASVANSQCQPQAQRPCAIDAIFEIRGLAVGMASR